MSRKALGIWLAGVVAAAAGFHLATLRDGHDWGGDFAQYIHHARNLLEGEPYAEIGSVPNPSVPGLGPRTFPPVFPILLVPVQALFGESLTAMKIQQVACLAGLLAILAAAFPGRLTPAGRIALTVLVGFSPYFWEMKDRIMSDLPFLVFTCAALWVSARPRRDTIPAEIRHGLAAGAMAYLAAGTRSVGLVLLPCLVAADLLRARRITPRTLAAAAAFAPPMALQAILLHSGGEYSGSFRPSLADALENARVYLWSLSTLWASGDGRVLRLAMLGSTGALAAIGYVSRIRRVPGVWEIFPAAYLAVLMAWPLRSGRLLAPIVPLYFLFGLEGLREIGSRLARRPRAALAGVMAAGVLVTWGGWYARADFGPLREGVGRPETAELFDFVRRETPVGAVFVFRKPRVLALYTDRPATTYHDPAAGPDMAEFLRGVSAAYLIAGPGDPPHWRDFLADHRERLERVFANGDFEVYRISAGGL